MYQDTRWDAEKRVLWIRHLPQEDWRLATDRETICFLADRVASLESLLREAVS